MCLHVSAVTAPTPAKRLASVPCQRNTQAEEECVGSFFQRGFGFNQPQPHLHHRDDVLYFFVKDKLSVCKKRRNNCFLFLLFYFLPFVFVAY